MDALVQNFKNYFHEFEQKNPRRAAHYYVLCGCFFLSTEMLFVKYLPHQTNPFQNASIRSIFALIFNSLLLNSLSVPIYRDIKVAFKGLCTRGLIGFSILMGMYTTFKYIPLGEGMVLLFMSPIWAFIMGKIILKEHFKVIDIILCIVTLFGVYLIFNPNVFGETTENDDRIYDNKKIGIILALTTSLIRAFSMVLVRSLSGKVDVISINQFQYVFSSVLGAVALLFLGNIYRYSLWDYFLLFLLGFFGCFGQYLGARSLKFENPGIVGTLGNVTILFSFIYDCIILNSKFEIFSVVGCILIIISTIFTLLINKK